MKHISPRRATPFRNEEDAKRAVKRKRKSQKKTEIKKTAQKF
jgi:hypothetical protein